VLHLPTQFDRILIGAVQCSRSFGGLPRLDAHERIWLEFRRPSCVAGVSLNDQPLPLPTRDPEQWDVSALLRARNQIVVDISDGIDRGWAECNLQVRGKVWLSDLRIAHGDGMSVVRGRLRGSTDQRLDLYVVANRRVVARRELLGAQDDQHVELDLDPLERSELSESIQVELVQGSVVWHSETIPPIAP
jgi:hypothetical protein